MVKVKMPKKIFLFLIFAAAYLNGECISDEDCHQGRTCFRKLCISYEEFSSGSNVEATFRYFFENKPIKETIYKHVNSKIKGLEWNEDKKKFEVPFYGIYDFCIGKKVKWNQKFVLIKGITETNINQKVIRYFITKDRATMMKKYDDGRIEAANKGYNAKLFQNYIKEEDYGINYEYYINECYKVTTPFDGGNPKTGKQLNLFE